MGKITAKYTLIFGIPKEDFFAKIKGESILFCEMRPNLLGVKILTTKLKKLKIKATLVSDNALGHLFYLGQIKKVCLFSIYGNVFPAGAQTVKILSDWHHVSVEVNNGEKISSARLSDKNALTFLGKKVTIRKIKTISPKNETMSTPAVDTVKIK